MLGVGIIGAGVMGGFHARLFAREISGARLVAVSDPDRGRAEAVAGSARILDEGHALIEDSSVDAVLIAAPDAAHHELVLAAIRAGKPVLCEKPLAETVEQCREIVAADRGVDLVSTGFMRRFDPAYRAMKAAVQDGKIGQPLVMHCTHRNKVAPVWLTGAMAITNAMVHEIDICRWMLGAEYRHARITQASAEGDLLLVELATDQASIVSIEVFMNAGYGYHVRAEVVGREGTVLMDNPALTTLRLNGAASEAYPTDWIGRFSDSYRLQDQAWVDACKCGRRATDIATAADGLLATDYALQLVRLSEGTGAGPLKAAVSHQE